MNQNTTKHLARALACVLLTGTGLNALTIYTFTGESSNLWTVAPNWNPGFIPKATDAVVEFGALTDTAIDRVNITFGSSFLDIPAVLPVAAFRFLDTLDSDADTFLVRNSSTSTAGTLRLHGYETDIGGVSGTLLIESHADKNIQFTPTNAGYTIELNNSGIVHHDGTGRLSLNTPITEAGGAQSITKSGSGTLRFSRLNATWSSADSTYTGGFILQDGIVEWAYSGSGSASPFGTGPLTLQGGNLRSTSESGRTVSNSVILDGSTEFGSLEEGFTGGITVNSVGGARSTTVASDSVLTTHSDTVWHQATSGDFGITKEGGATLTFAGTGGEIAHSGPTIVAAGTLVMNGVATNSDFEVLTGATLRGTGGLQKSVTIRSGGILAFGSDNATGQLTIGGPLTMEEESIMFFRLGDASLSDFDSLVAGGAIDLDGANLDVELTFQPLLNDSYLLIENQSGFAIGGSFSYAGTTLTEGSQFTVTSGEFSQLFSISYFGGSGDDVVLTAIPEPSAWGLFGAVIGLAALLIRRRQTA